MFQQQNGPCLIEENRQFSGTGGISEENSQARFEPAFQDKGTGKVEISRFQNGSPAPCHMLDGLPEEWVVERDHKGRTVKIKSTVISGFVRLGRFFTRQEAADFMQNLPVIEV